MLRFLAGVTLATVLMPAAVMARESILEDWENTYPESRSNDMECQLCHVNTFGGDPWNAYGWSIRELTQQGTLPSQAIRQVENLDADIDDDGLENFDEIIRNFQPGWRDQNNTYFFRDETTTGGHAPPSIVGDTAIDFPDALNDPITTAINDSPTSIVLDEVAGGFSGAVRAVKAPGIDGSLFVVEQGGRVFRTDLATGDKTLFLDVSDELVNCNECGLLGLAFHPNYETNRLFYTYQSEPADEVADFTTLVGQQQANHQSKIIEYRAQDASCNSNISKRSTLLVIDQPQSNHNGGDLLFDDEGYLYISLGDGGQASDYALAGHGLLGNGRDPETILGSILKIDPLGSNSANTRYGIPADNPFLGAAGLDEIYAFGFRNPFRMSFDAVNGKLYTGDVGQDDIEEIDEVIKGGNYGWNWKEGSFFFYYIPGAGNNSTRFVSNVSPPGLPQNLIDPIGEYDHNEGRSITGGYIYRGAAIDTVLGSDAVAGKYIFADLTDGIFELDVNTGVLKEFNIAAGLPGFITGFGQDADNELYLVTGAGSGSLFKITEAGDGSLSPEAEGESPICPPAAPSEDLCIVIPTSNGNIAQVCL